MNARTKEIATLLGISLEDALEVQDTIDRLWLLDWSECTQAQFERTARNVREAILRKKVTRVV